VYPVRPEQADDELVASIAFPAEDEMGLAPPGQVRQLCSLWGLGPLQRSGRGARDGVMLLSRGAPSSECCCPFSCSSPDDLILV
ncbi:MAG: hypothetical protein SGPRY_013628, partial [Prymnesium sp.]